MKFPFRLRISKDIGVLIGILLFFAGLYSCIVFVNHYLFRTFTGDLSYYSQTIYEFSLFRFGEYKLNWSIYWHTFGDHFEPILMLIAPLRYLFGTVTLLVVQMVSVLMGAVGLYRYVAHRTDKRWLPHLAVFWFCSFWGIYSALSFDFHPNVLASMMLPWLFDAFERKHWRASAIWLLLFVMCGEKMAFWAIFIGLGMALLHRKDRKMVIIALGTSVFSLIWMLISVKFIIPSFLNEGHVYRHFRLTEFGPNMGEAFLNMLQRPWFTFKAFFVNHLPDHPQGNHLKAEVYKMLLLSGGLILLWRPQYLLMLLPIFVGKMLNDLSTYWGINQHYSIEFIPLITIAVYAWLVRLRSARWQYGIAIFLGVMTFTVTMISFGTRYKEHYPRENMDIFYPLHWKRELYKPEEVYQALRLIPADAAVSASDRITPHLTMRDKLYRFPNVSDAEYVIISHHADTFPISLDETREKEKKMIESGKWEVILNNEAVVVLKRK